jgi:exodeoxyribonuclease V alpha subunit|nr:MAG TPA: ATP dependent DNA helicase [Caudoviricetes sp.]
MTDSNIIKIQARMNRILFPKYPDVLGEGGNNFGIVSWNPIDVIEGEPHIDSWGTIVVKGNYEEKIEYADDYIIIAKEVHSQDRGLQYELLYFAKNLDLSKVKNQKAFLKTFLSDIQIKEMYKVLDNPLEVIKEHDIESLKKVHGVGDYIANCIIERFEENRDNCEMYIELDKYGLTPKFIQKLVKKYSNPQKVIEIVKNNPYQLSFDVEGIGFKTADDIALKGGIKRTDPDRIKGYINYILNEQAQEGNSFITSGELTSFIFEEFGGKENILEVYKDENDNIIGNNINEAIKGLKDNGIIQIEENESKSQRRVYLTKYYRLEEEIAKHLKRIAKAENKFKYDDWEEILKQQEIKQGWTFTEEQRAGIKLGLDKQVCFITGGAGTGKSSLVSGILESLKNYTFAQTALAGKASARLQEVTGEEGYTIHRLLGFKPPYGFAFNENDPLTYDIIILDEISLVGGEIFLSLLKAIPNGTKLIILGDMGQLPSIGCMNLAFDLYNSNFITTIELTKVHRQAQKSGIITDSLKLRNQIPVLDKNFVGEVVHGELQDMYYDISDTTENTRSKVMKWFKEKYDSEIVKNIMDIQILCPCKDRGDSSVFNLNLDVQNYINPPSPDKKEIVVKQSKDKNYTLREGDKVMCIKNNYKVVGEHKTGVFNGWCGILTEITDYGFHKVYIPMIHDTMTFSTSDLINGVILGYASTVHKYQGSSARIIIGAFDNTTPPMMRTKELLYTLWTRAEKECITVAQNTALYNATKTSGVINKNTFLVELLDRE